MTEGSFSVEFSDFRDAYQALSLTCQNLFYEHDFQCFKLPKKQLAVVNGINPDTVSNHTAEYLLSVVDVGATTYGFNDIHIIDVCQNGVGSRFGEVKAFQPVRPLPGATATYRVEWYDSRVNAILLSGLEFHVSVSNPVYLVLS